MRVLVTDGQQRKSLAVARSLGSRGVQVIAAEDTRWAPTLFSKYCNLALVSPSPAKRPELYWQWLLEVWQQHRYDLLLPMDDHSLRIVVEHQAELSGLCRTLLPPLEGYRVAADKARTARLAGCLGIDAPQSFLPEDQSELSELAAGLGYPLVIKPRHSSGSRGITVVRRQEDLLPAYERVHARYPWPLLQEYIPQGEKFDVCLLYDQAGTLRASFVQKELRHFPLERGPSTVQESWHHPELLHRADRLMASLGWQGIAEVEFMIDPRDGCPQLMEINPRFWGSLACAIQAGVDFPWLYYQLLTEGTCDPPVDYPAGLLCRWLLPGDLLHFICSPGRFAMQPPLLPIRRPNLHDDTICWADPLPTLGVLSACLHYLTDKEMWQAMFLR